jgi:hypothetical protein
MGRALEIAKDVLFFNPRQYRRLSTHEDAAYFHAHKLAGIAVLAHFAWRTYLLLRYRNTFLDVPTWGNLAWLLLHSALHLTSFQFILPSRRNKAYNIIWPEMRWHSMIFAYRSILMMLVLMLSQQGFVPAHLVDAARPVLVIATMAAADAVTHHYKRRGVVHVEDSTMRGNPYPAYAAPGFVQAHNMFYSISQVFATMHVLDSKSAGPLFMTLIPIQTAPFGMTLVKKGILNQAGWHLYYTLALVLNYLHGWWVSPANVGTLPYASYWNVAAFFAVGRFALGMNKYVLWTIVIARFGAFYALPPPLDVLHLLRLRNLVDPVLQMLPGLPFKIPGF